MQIFCRGLNSRTSTLTVHPNDLIRCVKADLQVGAQQLHEPVLRGLALGVLLVVE